MNKEKTKTHVGKRKPGKTPTPNLDSLAASGERHQVAGGDHPALTTNQGLPVSDNQNSLRAHPRGPTLSWTNKPPPPAK